MAATSSNIYQFKIILIGTRPQIWRRIQVPENYSFWDLHVAITDAVGWRDCHAHQFEMIHPTTEQHIIIGMPDHWSLDFKEMVTRCETTTKIAEYFSSPKDRMLYEYDMGDGWEHEVIFEKILAATPRVKYPKCVAGKLAGPPEDSGGICRYRYIVKVLANPRHKEYEHFRDWLRNSGYGNRFNPKHFNPASVKFWDPKVRWQIRSGGRY